MSASIPRRLRYANINRLRALPIFGQIVKRLTTGQSAAKVIRWCMTLDLPEPWKSYTFHNWKNYVGAVAPYVNEAVSKLPRTRENRPAPNRVMHEVVRQVEAIPLICEAIPPRSRPIFEATRQAVNQLDAELILKRAAILAHERLLDIQEMQQKNGGKLFRNGMNEIVQFSIIADRLRRLEANQRKGLGRFGSTLDIIPPKEQTTLGQEFNKLDGVDQNLIRAATENVIEMIQEQALELAASQAAQEPTGSAASPSSGDAANSGEDSA